MNSVTMKFKSIISPRWLWVIVLITTVFLVLCGTAFLGGLGPVDARVASALPTVLTLLSWLAGLTAVFALLTLIAMHRHAPRNPDGEPNPENGEQEWRLTSILEYSSDFIGLARIGGDLFYMNKTARELTGLGQNEALDPLSIRDLFSEEDANELLGRIFPTILRKGKWEGELKVRNMITGEVIPLESHTYAIRSPQTGEMIAIANCAPSCDHIRKLLAPSAPKATNECLLEVTAPLARALRATVSTYPDESGQPAGHVLILHDITREREIEQLKTDFVASVSHELRTPLTSIKGFTSTILNDEEMPDQTRRHFLNVINAETDRLAALIEDLLEISRIENGNIQLQSQAIDMQKVIDRTLEILDSRIRDKDLELLREIPESLLRLISDPNVLQRILLNLLSNAIKFTPPSRVHWRASDRRGRRRPDSPGRFRHGHGHSTPGDSSPFRPFLSRTPAGCGDCRHRPGPGDHEKTRRAPGGIHHRGKQAERPYHVHDPPALPGGHRAGGAGRRPGPGGLSEDEHYLRYGCRLIHAQTVLVEKTDGADR